MQSQANLSQLAKALKEARAAKHALNGTKSEGGIL